MSRKPARWETLKASVFNDFCVKKLSKAAQMRPKKRIESLKNG